MVDGVARVVVEETVEAPRDAVFQILSDHGAYDRFDGINHAELVREGSEDRNGIGALRRIDFKGPVVLEEEVLAFDPPNSFEYRITKAKPLPIDQELGRMEFEDLGDGRTKVTWTSIYEVTAPVIGGFVSRRSAGQLEKDFRSIIGQAADAARAGSAA